MKDFIYNHAASRSFSLLSPFRSKTSEKKFTAWWWRWRLKWQTCFIFCGFGCELLHNFLIYFSLLQREKIGIIKNIFVKKFFLQPHSLVNVLKVNWFVATSPHDYIILILIFFFVSIPLFTVNDSSFTNQMNPS